jgi:hypothetical protein
VNSWKRSSKERVVSVSVLLRPSDWPTRRINVAHARLYADEGIISRQPVRTMKKILSFEDDLTLHLNHSAVPREHAESVDSTIRLATRCTKLYGNSRCDGVTGESWLPRRYRHPRKVSCLSQLSKERLAVCLPSVTIRSRSPETDCGVGLIQ